MIDAIRAFFGARMAPPPASSAGPDPDRLRLAACALLVELAWADGDFGDAERRHLREVLTGRMGIATGEADELVALADAERAEAHDYFQFTSLVAEHFPVPEKHHLLEMMWELVAADGEVTRAEDHLIRRVGPLLGIDTRSVADARVRVMARKSSGPDA